ncbi:hypothetical protein [Methylobacterium sp.]|nr:hypothetical protein [Methylobacterium sp.]
MNAGVGSGEAVGVRDTADEDGLEQGPSAANTSATLTCRASP